MGFISDGVFDGCRFPLLTLVDNCSRESLAFTTASVISGQGVVEVLYQPMQ